MNLYLRLFWLLLTSRRKSSAAVPETTTLRFRVLPNDLDANLHMNNGRYATIMDLGRIDLMQRLGLFRHVVKQRWMPLVAGLQLQFLRPLKPFQSYQLDTRVAAWDEKWVYIEQIFRTRDREVAKAVVKTQIRRGRQAVPISELMALVGYRGESPGPVANDWINYE